MQSGVGVGSHLHRRAEGSTVGGGQGPGHCLLAGGTIEQVHKTPGPHGATRGFGQHPVHLNAANIGDPWGEGFGHLWATTCGLRVR